MIPEFIHRGSEIEVKVISGEFARRIVWEAMEDGVLVCSPRQYNWLKRGDTRAAPIGFSWDDVRRVKI